MQAEEKSNLSNVTSLYSGESHWLISPERYDYYYQGDLNYFSSSTLPGGHYASTSILVKPVITLNSGTKIISGSGSKSDPWKVE